jgi:hypothetical protein
MSFSRRDFLKAGLAGSLAVGTGGLLSACGTGDTIKAFTTSNVGKPRYGGTLRAGLRRRSWTTSAWAPPIRPGPAAASTRRKATCASSAA